MEKLPRECRSHSLNVLSRSERVIYHGKGAPGNRTYMYYAMVLFHRLCLSWCMIRQNILKILAQT